jgi:hypothetical protein
MRAVAFGVGIVAALGMVSVAVAAMDDPDAPVATARYATAPRATQADAAQAEAAPATYVSQADPPLSLPARRFNTAVEDYRSHVDSTNGQLTGLATDVRVDRQAALEQAAFAAPLRRVALDQNLRRGFGEMRAIADKARFFLFAGDRGGVWTYSFTHDQGGVRASGWAAERADGDGEQRVGLAWQKGRTRVSLAGIERKFCQLGAEMKDRVVAMTVSYSPGWSTKRERQPS